MKCHELTQQQVLVFWGQKCGATCLKEIIMHLDSSGSFFDNGGNDDVTHQIYEVFYKNQPNYKDVDYYKNHKIVFFGRNPYHRIVSLYLDKYVAIDSPTPEINRNTNTFREFIEHIYNVGFFSENSQIEIFDGFFPITTGESFLFFEELLIKQTHAVFYLLPDFWLPDGKLIHDPANLRSLYDMAGEKILFEEIADRLTEAWNYKSCCLKLATNCSDRFDFDCSKKRMCDYTVAELRNVLKITKFDAMSFFTKELVDMFNVLYQTELAFYDRNKMSFCSLLTHIK